VLVLAAPAPRSGDPVTVAAIQPGYDTAREDLRVLRRLQPGTWSEGSLDLIGDLGALTRDAAARGARVVVWPEAAIWVDPRRDAPVAAALRDLSGATGAVLVVPYFLPDRDGGATVLVTPAGDLTRPQPKQEPMWFLGEESLGDAPPRPVRVAEGRVGTLLGVDNQEPSVARTLAARGAGLLTSSTHDWPQLAPHQRAFARLHARATRTPVVRADWRYGSAIIGARGEILADAGPGRRRAVVVAQVAPAQARAAAHLRRPPPAEAVAVALAVAALAINAALSPRTRRT
jgi:predicted amidohydrolase